MSTYTPPDKIEIYAVALQSDINSSRPKESPRDHSAISSAAHLLA